MDQPAHARPHVHPISRDAGCAAIRADPHWQTGTPQPGPTGRRESPEHVMPVHQAGRVGWWTHARSSGRAPKPAARLPRYRASQPGMEDAKVVEALGLSHLEKVA